jgi:endonuclease/exonuclease/phosphatase family metal-dependent hydrolase
VTSARLSLLTYNTGLLRVPLARFNPVPHVDERLAVIPTEILRLEADVVALQEVFQPRDRDAILARVRTRYPHVGHVPPRATQLDGGLLTFSRHPLRAHMEPFRDGPWSERVLSNKGALVTEVDLPDIGLVTVINQHATAGGFFALPESPRAEAMRRGQIAQLIALAAKARGTVLLVGDFNAGPGAAEANYRQLEAAGLTDLFAHLHGDDPSCTWDPKNELNARGLHRTCPPQRIDHVFVRADDVRLGRVTPRRARVVLDRPQVRTAKGVTVTPSDHYGLHAELEIARPVA